MVRILVADPLAKAGLEILQDSGAELTLLKAEDRPRLTEIIADYDALVVRSMTRVDAKLLERGTRLRVVGRAGIGVDNVDVAKATELGILVVNAPTANLVSATEHTFALLLALARNIPAADASLASGEWERKRFLGTELNGKILGVIGLGRIGQNVASRAKSFGMRVVAHDPFLDPSAAKLLEIEMRDLDELLAESDVVTLHTPLTEQTKKLLHGDRLRKMKRGSLLVNCARGGIVDEQALLECLESGQIGGAALDVFAKEPIEDLRLVKHPRVVATPHIGAQTREAQERVATETAKMVLAALEGSLSVTAVNLPFRSASGQGKPFMALGEQLGRLASTLLGGGLMEVHVGLWGIDEGVRAPTTIAALKGTLDPFLGEAVNFVNAEKVAQSRRIEVVSSIHHTSGEYPHLLAVRVKGRDGEVEVAGTVFADHEPRVVRLGGYQLEFRPKGWLLVVRNLDVPGVVGRLGTTLGDAGVNIAEIHLARQQGGSEALAVLRVDGDVRGTTLQRLEAIPEVESVKVVDLGEF